MVPTLVWQNQQQEQPYSGDTLSSEGFIHCTAEPDRLLTVANTWYQQTSGDWLILCIDEQLVEAELRWEENHGHIFPHVYGPLNLNAVQSVFPFPRLANGEFVLPSHQFFKIGG